MSLLGSMRRLCMFWDYVIWGIFHRCCHKFNNDNNVAIKQLVMKLITICMNLNVHRDKLNIVETNNPHHKTQQLVMLTKHIKAFDLFARELNYRRRVAIGRQRRRPNCTRCSPVTAQTKSSNWLLPTQGQMRVRHVAMAT